MYDVPFFTALDPDARIGSRDPLGFEQLWTALGRQVVGNLTTVTRSIRQFSTLLFGFYFADRGSEMLGDGVEFLPAFLRFEQLAAYARFHCYDETVHSEIRGIRAVKRNVVDCRRRPWLSSRRQRQILSDQKTYGLYGLFRTAARSSGLLRAKDGKRLSPRAIEHVEQRFKAAGFTAKLQDQIVRSITRDTQIDLQSDIVRAVAQLLRPELDPAEVQFYGSHLVRGDYLNEPLDVQRRLWEVLETVNRNGGFHWADEFSMGELIACADEARQRGDDELAEKLDRIRRAEQLLGAAEMLYGYLLNQDNQDIGRVVAVMRQNCGELPWLDVCGIGFAAWNERLGRLAGCLRSGDYETAGQLLIEQNKEVMRERGGSAWIVLKGNCLEVRLQGESNDLPEAEDLSNPWAHTYFLGALKRVGAGAYYGQREGDENGA